MPVSRVCPPFTPLAVGDANSVIAAVTQKRLWHLLAFDNIPWCDEKTISFHRLYLPNPSTGIGIHQWGGVTVENHNYGRHIGNGNSMMLATQEIVDLVDSLLGNPSMRVSFEMQLSPPAGTVLHPSTATLEQLFFFDPFVTQTTNRILSSSRAALWNGWHFRTVSSDENTNRDASLSTLRSR